MEGVGTRCQVDFLRLTSFGCPAFYGCSFCLVAFKDLDLCTCDFSTAEINFTESNSLGTVIVFIRYSNFRTISYDLVFFILRIFFSYASHFHCTVCFDLEGDVGYFEVTGRGRFLMESIGTWRQVDVFRLVSFRCPAFNSCTFCLVALVNLNLCTGDFCAT